MKRLDFKHKLFSSGLLISASLLLSTILLPSVAQAEKAVDTIKVEAGWDSNNMKKIVAHTGREVVHHLVAAADALEKNDSGKARGNLVAAQRLNYSALQMMPFLSVSEDVLNAKGKLAMEETDIFYDQLLPIYSQLNELEVYVPDVAKKARKHLKRAEELSHKGAVKAAIEPLADAVAVLSGTTVYMPVLYVEGQLKAALYGLNQPKRDINMAREAINNALESLSVFSEEVIIAPPSS